jgi:hypothetical protein
MCQVFVVTTVFSIFAYLWLIVVLILISPNEVELWEAVITLLFFPILVITAYIADRNFFRKPPPTSDAVKKFAVGSNGLLHLCTPLCTPVHVHFCRSTTLTLHGLLFFLTGDTTDIAIPLTADQANALSPGK